jgi:hypothetical protein
MDRAMMASSFCCMGKRMNAASENCVSAMLSTVYLGCGPGRRTGTTPSVRRHSAQSMQEAFWR